MVKWLLHLEGLCVLLLALSAYATIDASWMLFIVCFFVPDISLLGYLVSPTLGAANYNIAHTYTLAFALIATGLFAYPVALPLGIILAAHIGMDRMLGFGLKYEKKFSETHLQKI